MLLATQRVASASYRDSQAYDEVCRGSVDGRQDVDGGVAERASLAGRLVASVQQLDVARRAARRTRRLITGLQQFHQVASLHVEPRRRTRCTLHVYTQRNPRYQLPHSRPGAAHWWVSLTIGRILAESL